MDNILDHVVVQGHRYDIVSPTAFGDYIETIGSACINPDGYAQGSTFLARLGNEQFYYEATAAITQGAAINEGTNCKKTTVTGRESELASDIQTLSNQIEAVAENGAVNLLPNDAASQVVNGITFTVNNDGSVTVSGTATATAEITIAEFYLDTKSYKFSGTPSGGSSSTYFIYHNEQSVGGIQTDVGSGATFTVQNKTHKQYLKIQIANGFAVPGTLTFKPMITLSDQPNSDYAHYVPYAMTNRELTERIITTPSGWDGTLYQAGNHIYGNLNKVITAVDTSNGRALNIATFPYYPKKSTFCVGQCYASPKYVSCTFQIGNNGNVILIAPDDITNITTIYIQVDIHV